MADESNPRTGMFATVRNRRGVFTAVEACDGCVVGRVRLLTTLKPVACEIPALRKRKAGSINQTFRLVSESSASQPRSRAALKSWLGLGDKW
jgi:hypothetical protein